MYPSASPLEIKMLLHFYAVAEPFPGLQYPSQQLILQRFLREGLIFYSQKHDLIETTTKGERIVKRLLRVAGELISIDNETSEAIGEPL